MLQIDPINSNCSQKLHYLEKKLRVQVLRKNSSMKEVAIPKVTLGSVNVYNCSSKNINNCNFCCEIVILTHFPSEWDRCKCFRAFNTVFFK